MPKLIPLSSKDFDEKLNSPQHRISVDDAKNMKEKHDRTVKKPVEKERENNGKPLKETKSVWFSKKVLDAIFDKEIGCDGVRIYFGSHLPKLSDGRDMGKNVNKSTTILVGTKPGKWTRENGEVVDAEIDQISEDDKIAIAMLSGDVIYDLGSMCPKECDGTKL